MRYKTVHTMSHGETVVSVVIDRGNDEFTSFPASAGNPAYDSFLESKLLTDAEVQAMEPDIWHDMA